VEKYPHDDSVVLLDLEKFTLKEPNFGAMCFLNDGNREQKNDTISIRQ